MGGQLCWPSGFLATQLCTVCVELPWLFLIWVKQISSSSSSAARSRHLYKPGRMASTLCSTDVVILLHCRCDYECCLCTLLPLTTVARTTVQVCWRWVNCRDCGRSWWRGKVFFISLTQMILATLKSPSWRTSSDPLVSYIWFMTYEWLTLM